MCMAITLNSQPKITTLSKALKECTDHLVEQQMLSFTTADNKQGVHTHFCPVILCVADMSVCMVRLGYTCMCLCVFSWLDLAASCANAHYNKLN